MAKVIIILIFSLSIVSSNALAIDCRKPLDNITSIICSDSEILTLDKSLNKHYNDILRKIDNKEKNILRNSQREWLKFVEDAACTQKFFYPECDKNKSEYKPETLRNAYKNRIKFLQSYQKNLSISKFLKIWHFTAGSLNNMHFSGAVGCSTHESGLHSCLKYPINFEVKKYNFIGSNCYYRNSNNGIYLTCISHDGSKLISEYFRKENSVDLQYLANDLLKYMEWYGTKKQEIPKYESAVIKKLINKSQFGYLRYQVQTRYMKN